MKTKLITIAVIFAAVVFIASPPPAQAYNQMQGVYVDGSTNTVTVSGVSTNVGFVALNNTNTFNLAVSNGSQADTNKWPSITFGGNYGLNSRLVAFQWGFKGYGTNTCNSTIVLAASTLDGRWVSNFITLNLTGGGTAEVNNITNIDTGGYPFLGLQAIINTNSTIALTNYFISATSKPGL